MDMRRKTRFGTEAKKEALPVPKSDKGSLSTTTINKKFGRLSDIFNNFKFRDMKC